MDASQAFAWLGVAHLMLTLMDVPESASRGEQELEAPVAGEES